MKKDISSESASDLDVDVIVSNNNLIMEKYE